ncbi:alpha-ketoglutarate-dependent dioxygenase AlkB family protein [Nocardiopsis sp. LOL_012]|uniref:alpha-ketoglutarate-dependent dioxygenase AlkB family protein n=1 Tax=Nocardiopsis sp. LOL_012 TaxID=3345409 RepID=UPI003A8C04B6
MTGAGGRGAPEPDPLFDTPPVTVAPEAVHLPGWLPTDRQGALVEDCRRWARAGMVRHRMPGGGLMSVRTLSMGWFWSPARHPPPDTRRHGTPPGYSRTLPDGSPVPPMPGVLVELAARAVRDALGRSPDPRDPYDVALVNFYGPDARMGMHQDRDERSRAPVVSLSLGDTCVFRFGNTETRNRPHTDIALRSGDLFVFGGPSRTAYHGVVRVRPGTAPPGLGLEGRLNITVRASGLGR